jgi:class 3 adenylate cyclase/tetratricopeptide (TPR) repeat protein
MPIERKLAAIMFTDIAGYTEQMSKDQDLAFILLEEKQSKFKPLIKEHNGTLIKEMGDGTLSQYPTAVDASKCSVELQKLIQDNDKLNVRIGIHLGDTLFKDGDVFGDGVNIAARLESMSPAGGILVSKNVYDELLSRQGFEGVSLGLQSLKGVGRLVEVYALKDAHLTVPNPDDYTDTKVDVHTDDEVPSIAIIPFDNKGADEDVFYAYGISADLISDCSSAGLIRVASKTDIEKLDYQNLDNSELSQKLDVRYMANGELWRMGDMFQLSVELYDTKDKKVVWSDRWQEKWDNLPTIKGSLSDGLLKALDTKPKIEQKIETTNPEAYEFYLKAKHKYEKRENTDDTDIARGLLNKAIDIDDNLISAKNLLGTTYRDIGGYDKAMEIYTSALKQAEELGDKHSIGTSLKNIGGIYWYKAKYNESFKFYSRSLNIATELGNKNIMAESIYSMGVIYWIKGEFNRALEYFNNSLKISEEIGDKSGIGKSLNRIGVIYGDKGDFNKALYYFNQSLQIQNEIGNKRRKANCLSNIGIAYSKKGDPDTALGFYERSLKIKEQIGDKFGMGFNMYNIGTVFTEKGNYPKAIDLFEKSLNIRKELDDKRGIGMSLTNIGIVYSCKGELNTALEYFNKSLDIREELGDKRGIAYSLSNIGIIYYNKREYNKSLDFLQKSLSIQKEIELGADDLIKTTTYLYLNYKKIGKGYDVNEIHRIIKEVENIEFELNHILYELLEDTNYLEKAYNQIQKKVDAMDDKLKEIFLNYSIPRQIMKKYIKLIH